MTNVYDEMSVAPDPARAEELRQRLRARMTETTGLGTDESLIPTISISNELSGSQRAVRRRLVVAAAIIVVALGVVGIAIGTRRSNTVKPTPVVTVSPQPDRGDTSAPPPTSPPSSIGSVPVTVPANGVRNGWAAFTVEVTDGTSHIYLGREGEVPRPVVVEGAKTGGEACPAFSPDGTRLMIWRFRELEILSVAEDGSVTPVASVPLQDGTEPTCATWAPDGRWIAFYDTGGVFVADTVTGTARQVVDYLPTDLEWRPGSDELAIAGEVDGEAVIGSWSNGPLILYSVSTEQTHTIANIDVRDIAWSPDGATLAYTQYTWDGIGGHERTSGIALMNADGSNRRSLTTNDHRAYIQKEVTIQWSPRGDLIAYGRPCDGCPGPVEVVLVTTTDEDPAKPLGTETVVSPPVIETAGGSVAWYPATFSWAPDGSRLLYESTATSSGPGGVVVVPIASDEPPRQLSDRSDVPGRLSEPVDPTQRWARAG